ncbi:MULTISPECIES: hypothetical protein [Leuconostoc gelidum group]|uniref:Uncharacterized protein n=2 Tax=Leuconostoc gelidum group TaxID=3016637 RepID=A0A9Q3SXU0_9LACO|nr:MULTISPECIES: hypothetical protein [Leuconostoc gelidum group]AFS39510.1 hypothetical protein C269_00315 [Leuconostoc gelidum JB7]MBZ5953166.1 hypothetical protein [Leuconostoc gasicomitatum]MBZ5962337.1 hypothetical protein [Leuconostoc gasicomitatum]MBZ5965022.1 hypothetical protein [Leuconostoc gelidum subsp. gelidum]MBZ5974413.1 hypothetical protein [Leuconostoc gelidum subsp. gelidum]
MFKTDKRKYLLNFLEEHPNLNSEEKKIISDTVNKMNEPNSLWYKEVKTITNALQKLSMYDKSSDDGKVLLKQLNRSDWFYGLYDNIRFFG